MAFSGSHPHRTAEPASLFSEPAKWAITRSRGGGEYCFAPDYAMWVGYAEYRRCDGSGQCPSDSTYVQVILVAYIQS